jgi:hypothetical protein
MMPLREEKMPPASLPVDVRAACIALIASVSLAMSAVKAFTSAA